MHAERIIDYERGLTSAESLSADERFVYVLIELETTADMEGWDHFFTTGRLCYYGDLVAGLTASRDDDSLLVLHGYERHLRELGVVFQPDAIAAFLDIQSESYFQNCRDWRSEFACLAETRWKKIADYLATHGVNLKNS